MTNLFEAPSIYEDNNLRDEVTATGGTLAGDSLLLKQELLTLHMNQVRLTAGCRYGIPCKSY